MITCKTICMTCQHHNGAPATSVWYDHFCLAPAIQRTKEQNPVTGLLGFFAKNSLGDIYATDNAHPYCRDINHGNCEHYTLKE